MATHLVLLLILSVTSSWAQTTPPAATHRPKNTPAPGPDMVTEMVNRGNFNTLLSLLNSTGLLNTLQSAPEITLFAPTDDAFARLPASTLQALQGDANLLKSILSFHAVADSYTFRGHYRDHVLMSLNNKPIRLSAYGNVHVYVAVEGVNVTTRNIRIQNGYLNEIDGVMVPPEGNIVDIVEKKDDLKEIASLLTQSGLKDTVKNDMNITVFLPNDNAFRQVDSAVMTYLGSHPDDLKEVILYHVVSRTTLYSIGMKHSLTFPTADHHHDRIMTLEDDMNNIYINNAKLVERDISATNGVIHVIDKVLIPAKILLNIEEQGIVVG